MALQLMRSVRRTLTPEEDLRVRIDDDIEVVLIHVDEHAEAPASYRCGGSVR